jgi:hypothetical protein
MSTRATYKIDGVCFYIHYDGYKDGAAVYFWNMHQAMGKGRGGYAEAFLRGNDLAEFTKSHDWHGDTEYRYDLKGETLIVWERADWSDTPKFKEVWSGYWWEFVNQHPRMIEGFERLAKINGRVSTRTELVARIAEVSNDLATYSTKFPTYTGNINGIKADLQRAEDALKTYEEA